MYKPCNADAGTWISKTRGSAFGVFGKAGKVIWIGTIFDGSKPMMAAGGGAGAGWCWATTGCACAWCGTNGGGCFFYKNQCGQFSLLTRKHAEWISHING